MFHNLNYSNIWVMYVKFMVWIYILGKLIRANPILNNISIYIRSSRTCESTYRPPQGRNEYIYYDIPNWASSQYMANITATILSTIYISALEVRPGNDWIYFYKLNSTRWTKRRNSRQSSEEIFCYTIPTLVLLATLYTYFGIL